MIYQLNNYNHKKLILIKSTFDLLFEKIHVDIVICIIFFSNFIFRCMSFSKSQKVHTEIKVEESTIQTKEDKASNIDKQSETSINSSHIAMLYFYFVYVDNICRNAIL